jgi:hypothetical protein
MPFPIHISRDVYNQFITDLNILLIEQIVNNLVEYEALNMVVDGLSPRMKVNIMEHITIAIRNLFNNEHPIILNKLVLTIMQALNASVISLFSIRPKNSFTPVEIKNYLYTQLIWLLDVDNHYPSLLGNYIIIDNQNTEPLNNNAHE